MANKEKMGPPTLEMIQGNPYNYTFDEVAKCMGEERANKQQLVAFKIRLEEAGLEVKLRESRGNRIKAACGQLVSDYNKGNDAPTSDSPEKMSPVIHKLSSG